MTQFSGQGCGCCSFSSFQLLLVTYLLRLGESKMRESRGQVLNQSSRMYSVISLLTILGKTTSRPASWKCLISPSAVIRHLKNLEEHTLILEIWLVLKIYINSEAVCLIVGALSTVMGGSQSIYDDCLGNQLSPLSACLAKTNMTAINKSKKYQSQRLCIYRAIFPRNQSSPKDLFLLGGVALRSYTLSERIVDYCLEIYCYSFYMRSAYAFSSSANLRYDSYISCYILAMVYFFTLSFMASSASSCYNLPFLLANFSTSLFNFQLDCMIRLDSCLFRSSFLSYPVARFIQNYSPSISSK